MLYEHGQGEDRSEIFGENILEIKVAICKFTLNGLPTAALDV
jgi:hypothetical protein